MPQTEPMSAEDYVKFYNDVKIHFEMLCTDRMRRHAYADPVAHDLAFQVFRVLSGYEQALEEIAQRQAGREEALNKSYCNECEHKYISEDQFPCVACKHCHIDMFKTLSDLGEARKG